MARAFLSGLLSHSLVRHPWCAFHVTVTFLVTWALIRYLRKSHQQQLRTTQLAGPPRESVLYGVGRRILDAEDAGAVYESWAQKYGPVYMVPSTLGMKRIVLCDPKAIAHFQTKDTWTYVQIPLIMKSLDCFLGRGLFWAHGENHRRQRRCLTPAFGIPAIRQLTQIFYDSAYKAKGAWDALIESGGGDSTLIEIQSWMNHISLDSIGLACFSRNFGALQGKHEAIIEAVDMFSASSTASAINKKLTLLADAFPFLVQAPTSRGKLRGELNAALEEVLNVVLAQTQQEMNMGIIDGKQGQSAIGLLIKAMAGDSEFHMTKDEVMSQMKVLLMAGYETSSISLSWALLELSRYPEAQTKLRDELIQHGADPTYDQLTNCFPYLDAVVHEVLRLHLPVTEITRMAAENDIIPLSEPVHTTSGKLVNSLTIAKGTQITISMECMNRAAAIWGNDAKVFRPSRWLAAAHAGDGIPAKAKDIPGHRHLLTFFDGPRVCLGKHFALTELKAVLTVLVKNFVFELRDGVDSNIEIGRGLLPRPKLAGETGCKLPLRVYPYNH